MDAMSVAPAGHAPMQRTSANVTEVNTVEELVAAMGRADEHIEIQFNLDLR